MAFKLFGFNITRDEPNYLKNDKITNDPVSFINQDATSTSVEIFASPYASGSILDLNGNLKTEADFITKYRDMCNHPEVQNAISEIVNEAISTDEDFIVKIDLDNVTSIDENSKLVIKEQFDEILRLLDFKNLAYEIFKRWYVDGRLYYHAVIDFQNPTYGIQELRFVDPRKIREIKEVTNAKLATGTNTNGVNQQTLVKTTKNNYYLYNETGFGRVDTNTGSDQQYKGIRITKDSVVHIPSGETDVSGKIGLSFLHMAIKSLNELRTIEDSLIIYRLARAPERRVWQIDVSNMPPKKAEEHLKKVADLQKNRLIYDSTNGTIKDDRKFATITEDLWLPKRADGVGTSVDVLQGGQNLGNIEDVVYFQKRLYNSLNVPVDRLQADTPFSGNTQEISRSEVKFDKFITRLRQRFQLLFTRCLERHVVLKGLMSYEEFKAIEKDIEYEFARDNHFAELIDQQVIGARINTFMQLQQSGLIGTYFSHQYIRRNIFKQTQEDIAIMNDQIMIDQENPLYAPPDAAMSGEDDGSGGSSGGGANPDFKMNTDVTSHSSQSSSYIAKHKKIENAKHLLNALSGDENRNPTQQKQYRSAAQIVARNSK